MFEVTLADSRTALADTDNPEDLALILEGTKAFFNANISNPNAPTFKVKEAVAMRQAPRQTAKRRLLEDDKDTIEAAEAKRERRRQRNIQNNQV